MKERRRKKHHHRHQIEQPRKKQERKKETFTKRLIGSLRKENLKKNKEEKTIKTTRNSPSHKTVQHHLKKNCQKQQKNKKTLSLLFFSVSINLNDLCGQQQIESTLE